MRGSRYPTTRSTSMFAMTNMTPATITTATIAFRSLLSIAFSPYFENPGQQGVQRVKAGDWSRRCDVLADPPYEREQMSPITQKELQQNRNHEGGHRDSDVGNYPHAVVDQRVGAPARRETQRHGDDKIDDRGEED